MTRANELTTKRATLAAFVRTGSAQFMLPAVVVLLAVRLLVGGWGRGDLVVLIGVVIATGPLEWFIHRNLLHADPTSWSSRTLGTGSGHREHHLDPPELPWLLLRAIDAAVFTAILAISAVAVTAPVAWLIGGRIVPSCLTAITLAAIGLAHYEWTHLLVHTAYRPRTRYYARLDRNHRRHHYRNEHYWLGVTSNLGDRIMRTLPAADDQVPRSDTARTLAG
jgi:hypothetical protein